VIGAASAMLPLVSFVIPVKNSASRLQRLLATVVANDYPRELVEILVVDNESTDTSAQVARDGGATLLRSSASSVAEVRNSAAREARGSILAFVDADHEITREWIRTAVDVLSAEGVAAAGAPYLTERSPSWVQRHYDAMRDRVVSREEVQWLGSGNLAIKKSVFDDIGGFDASLTACEDVDLCNRVRLAGHRIVADPGMRSVHYGDPKTLKALFYGELWRGRDNVRVTFRGPWTFRHLRSALIPIIDLIVLAAGVIALLLGHAVLAVGCWLVFFGLAALRTVMILRRQPFAGITSAAQALAVATVFDVAKALALLARGSHRARRSS
jgi:glycosyltransferase involved in cell wall biosynthesis